LCATGKTQAEQLAVERRVYAPLNDEISAPVRAGLILLCNTDYTP